LPATGFAGHRVSLDTSTFMTLELAADGQQAGPAKRDARKAQGKDRAKRRLARPA
jgi:hypothetical protein